MTAIFYAVSFWSWILLAGVAGAQPLLVNSYYGTYDAASKTPGLAAKSLTGPKTENWRTSAPAKRYHIGVLFPHLQDPYWRTANYGIVSYARKLGLQITLYTAGAYIDFGNQRAQMLGLICNRRVDGILLVAVDYTKLDPCVAKADRAGIPVVGLINDIHAPAIRAKSAVSFFDMGYQVGRYILRHARGADCKIALFPGPENTGWAPDTVPGFAAALTDGKGARQQIVVLKPLYGDTRPDVQRMRLDMLQRKENHQVDYIVANAVAAVEAIGFLNKHRDIQPRAKIVSTYITDPVYDQIKKGSILAAPSEQALSQCRIGLDMIVNILNGDIAGQDFPFRAAPLIPMITADNIDRHDYEALFGPKGFEPVYEHFDNPKQAGVTCP